MNKEIAGQCVGCSITANGHQCRIVAWGICWDDIHFKVELPNGEFGWIHWKLAGQPEW